MAANKFRRGQIEEKKDEIERDKEELQGTHKKYDIFWLIYLMVFGGLALGLLLSKN